MNVSFVDSFWFSVPDPFILSKKKDKTDVAVVLLVQKVAV